MVRKTIIRTFQATNKRNLSREDFDMDKNESLKKKAESLFLSRTKNALRADYVKAKLDKTQQNSKCMLFGEREE